MTQRLQPVLTPTMVDKVASQFGTATFTVTDTTQVDLTSMRTTTTSSHTVVERTQTLEATTKNPTNSDSEFRVLMELQRTPTTTHTCIGAVTGLASTTQEQHLLLLKDSTECGVATTYARITHTDPAHQCQQVTAWLTQSLTPAAQTLTRLSCMWTWSTTVLTTTKIAWTLQSVQVAQLQTS